VIISEKLASKTKLLSAFQFTKKEENEITKKKEKSSKIPPTIK
jgi:hypothetical protein